ncbi:MAG TPA: 50S ribosomal protein L25 [Gemmataceae bacterium]|nr:50S ribosomal protein L25 [Gemmataceae bacterium]
MAESMVLEIDKREGRGTRIARKLRTQGRVPGVVYGHKEETVSVSVAAEALLSAVRHGARVVDLRSDGGLQKAQIAELQWDHLGMELLHVDFRRVAADERIHVTVPVEVRGIAPGVTAGGILDQPIHTLAIECAADSVPESIRVNINELQLGAAIHVRDLHLPEGVQALADADAIVVHVTAPQAAPETVAVPGAEQAEPEVIGRKAAAEEGEEEK